MSLDAEVIDNFHSRGAALLRNVFSSNWITKLRKGLDVNLASPGPYMRNYSGSENKGMFIGDYCNWQRIKEYKSFLFESPAAKIAAELMGSSKVNLFHEHVLVKEPGTQERTPWHHDQPYYCVDGQNNCSLWIPLDPVTRDTCVQFVSNSHNWGKWFTPIKFVGTQFRRQDEGYEMVPDIESEREKYEIMSWDMEPGDCIAFHFLTVHGAPGNLSLTNRRRAFVARFTGDDAIFVKRKGEMSPPFPEVTLKVGQPLDSETFPVLLNR